MKYLTVRAAAAALAMSMAMSTAAMAKNPMVGGAAMYDTRNIVQNAVNSKDHTTLVAAVKAAGLVDTLSSPGPFTVFAPTDAAFAKLPPAMVEMIGLPESKAKVANVLTYHVVPGRLTTTSINSLIKKGKGSATLTTVQGEPLIARMQGKALLLTDAMGGTSRVTIANVMQSNGVIHVVDTVLMP